MTKIIASGLAGLLLLITAGCSSVARQDDPTRDWDAQRFYTEGQDALRAENYTQAIEYFRQLQRRYPADDRGLPSQLEIAYAWYKLDNAAEAVTAADRYIDAPGNQPHVDYAYYLKGLARYQDAMQPADTGTAADHVRQIARLREAFREFASLTRSHPNSKYTEDALQRMVDIRNKLGELEVKIARLTLVEGKAAAAAKRAEHIVEHYEQSPAAPEAYVVMIDAYTALGLSDQALNARLALQTKHPDYRYTAATDAPPEKAADTPVAIEKAPAGRPAAAPPAPPALPAPARAATPVLGGAAPTQPAGAATRTEANREGWLLAQRPDHYTLQLLATSDRNALVGFIARHRLHDNSAYFSTAKGTQRWYALVYGSYDTLTGAKQAVDELPAALRRANPWIRRFGDIQAAIQKEQPMPAAAPATPAQGMPPLPHTDPAGAIH